MAMEGIKMKMEYIDEDGHFVIKRDIVNDYLNKLKIWLWKFTKSEKCPICKKQLIPHYDYYTCQNKKCEFNY